MCAFPIEDLNLLPCVYNTEKYEGRCLKTCKFHFDQTYKGDITP